MTVTQLLCIQVINILFIDSFLFSLALMFTHLFSLSLWPFHIKFWSSQLQRTRSKPWTLPLVMSFHQLRTTTNISNNSYLTRITTRIFDGIFWKNCPNAARKPKPISLDCGVYPLDSLECQTHHRRPRHPSEWTIVSARSLFLFFASNKIFHLERWLDISFSSCVCLTLGETHRSRMTGTIAKRMRCLRGIDLA